jgi:2-polyprenyl-6-methoxyphenol hydroxylase-like FAD-dependent oxidoreductase
VRDRYDAIVVGARCAGAATAMLLARQGLSVLLVDRDRHGSDTLSTLALMRAGVLQLHRWGLLDRVLGAGTPKIKFTSFVYGDETITLPIKLRDGVDALYAPRRTLLDALLADAAAVSAAAVAGHDLLLQVRIEAQRANCRNEFWPRHVGSGGGGWSFRRGPCGWNWLAWR